jgi:ATP-binding cassette subfamily C protein CydC
MGLAVVTLSGSLGLVALSGAFLTDTGLAGLVPATAPLYNTVVPAGAIRLLALLRVAGRWSERVVSHDATLRLLGDLRVWLYGRLSRLSPRQLGLWHGAEVLNRLTRDIDVLDNLYVRLLSPTVAAGVVVVLCCGVAATVSPSSALPIAALALITVVVLALLFAGAKTLTPRLIARQGTLRTAIVDLVESLDDTALHHPAWLERRHAVLSQDALRLDDQTAFQRRGAGARSLIVVLVGVAALTAAWTSRSLPGPWCVALTLMALGTSEALLGLPAAWLELPGTAAAAERVSALAEQTPQPEFSGTQVSAGRDLVLENVGFAFDGQPVLAEVSWRWPLGTHAAVVGPSGGGKSTMARLLTRLEDPTEGRLTLGGLDLREWGQTELRDAIACAPQDPWAFRMTLVENLRLAAPEAAEDELWTVLDLVGLAEQVRTWPQGWNTLVEEGGASLSGGQRKRLAVAQALLRGASVTVLDEPTEGLDGEAALALVAAVRSRLTGRTLIWISHRPEGLETFDEIRRLDPIHS